MFCDGRESHGGEHRQTDLPIRGFAGIRRLRSEALGNSDLVCLVQGGLSREQDRRTPKAKPSAPPKRGMQFPSAHRLHSVFITTR